MSNPVAGRTSYPELSDLGIDGLRDVWLTHSDPDFAEQAHVRLLGRLQIFPSWVRPVSTLAVDPAESMTYDLF